MNAVPPCYGTMFPDVLYLKTNQVLRGKVFGGLLKSAGMFIQDRNVTVDEEQWRKCVACESYRHCYDLSVAKLLLQRSLS